ncbi:MAG: putative repeat protein (TIGR01451 family), partial [Myxococcota bacterium]
PTLGGPSVFIHLERNSSLLYGTSQTAETVNRPVLWEPQGAATFSLVELPTLVPDGEGWTAEYDGSGTLIGRSRDANGGWQPVSWVTTGNPDAPWAIVALPFPLSEAVTSRYLPSGQIVGQAWDGSERIAVVWSPDASAPSGWRYEVPSAISGAEFGFNAGHPEGLVAGFTVDGGGREVAAIWTPAEGAEGGWNAIVLPDLGGADSQALHVSTAGVAAGWAKAEGSVRKLDVGWVSSPDDPTRYTIHVLPDLGTADNDVVGVTDNGLIGGNTENELGRSHAVLWAPDATEDSGFRIIDLGAQGGVRTTAYAMNRGGLVVGRTLAGSYQAAAWAPDVDGNWIIVNLAAVVGHTKSEATHVSDAGLIAGTVRIDGTDTATVWRRVSGTWEGAVLPSLGRASEPTHVAGSFVIGTADSSSGLVHVVWHEGPTGWTMVELSEPDADVALLDVNDTGLVVGTINEGPATWVPDGAGAWTTVVLGSAFTGAATTVTDDGVIGGRLGMVDGPMSATVWVADAASENGWRAIVLGFEGGVAGAAGPLIFGHNTSANNGFFWGCAVAEGALLSAWRVIYRTDRPPRFTFEAQVDDVCQTQVTNLVNVSTTTPEITTANNSSSASIGVETANLSVSATVDQVVAGESDSLGYVFEVANAGPDIARDVQLLLAFPNGVGASSQALQVGDLAAGERWSHSMSAVVTTSAADAILAVSATAESATIDCAPGDNAATATTVTGTWPNARVTITAPEVVRLDTAYTYDVSWANNGNAPVAIPVVSATLPEGVLFQGASLAPSAQNGQTLSWNLGASLAEGASGALTIDVIAPGCTSPDDTLVATTEITTPTVEATISDNRDSTASSLLGLQGRLRIRLTPSRATVETGETLSYTVLFDNPGVRSVDDVAVVASVPDGTTLVAGSATPGAIVANGALTWSLDALESGASGSASYVVRVNAPSGALTAVATATGSGACDAPVANATTTVAPAGLHIVKVASQQTTCGAAETPVTWQLTVTNTSDTPMSDVLVSDVVPEGLAYVGGSVFGPGAADASAPTLTWHIAALAPHSGLTIGYETRAPAGERVWVNSGAATATSGGALAQSAETVVRGDCDATLALEKAWSGQCGVAGDTVDVSLVVTHAGGDTVTDAVLVDTVPDGLDFAGSDDGGVFDATSRVVTFAVGTLVPGARATYGYQVTLTGATPGAILHSQASIAGSGAAPRASNVVAGVTLACDDGNDCTVASCGPNMGCVYAPAPAGLACDDGDACTQIDSCTEGATCAGADPVVCEALDVCHVAGTCQSATGACTNPPAEDGLTCDDSDVCTLDDQCADGVCAGPTPRDCDDDDVCTADSCDAVAGCGYDDAEDGLICDDGNQCSTVSECRSGLCDGTVFMACNDGDPCTVDACEPATGCVAEAGNDGATCSDDLLCTGDDVCFSGICLGTALPCAEPNACQLNGACNPATGICDFPAKPGDVPVAIDLVALPTLGGDFSQASAIGADGWVVGQSETADGALHAFRWHALQGMEDLTPGHAGDSEALAINDAGQVVGVLHEEDGSETVFLWTDTDGVELLWTRAFVDGAPAPVFGPSPDSVVAGNAIDAGGALYAAVRDAVASTTIASPIADATVVVRALGDGGQVVGEARPSQGGERALVWTRDDGATLLTATGTSASSASAVSPIGHVAGYVVSGGERTATRWLFGGP